MEEQAQRIMELIVYMLEAVSNYEIFFHELVWDAVGVSLNEQKTTVQ